MSCNVCTRFATRTGVAAVDTRAAANSADVAGNCRGDVDAWLRLSDVIVRDGRV